MAALPGYRHRRAAPRGRQSVAGAGPGAALVSTASAGTSGQARCSRWRTRTGAPWRDVPERHGPWDRVCDLFRCWQRDGTWAGIVTRLQAEADAKGLITWDVNVDSTVCRAHQHAAGASKKGDLRKEPPGGIAVEPADHGIGRSRGGLTTKVHLAVEQGQKPLSVLITAGQRGDSPQFEPVLDAIGVPRLGRGRPRRRPDRVRADKAYDSRRNRACLRRRGIKATIPVPADRVRNRQKLGSRGGRPPKFDRTDYRGRHMKHHRDPRRPAGPA
ncbi:IS5 family transposase [Streptomyces hygroscopicus]|uniref:IS5 family transposase n=1 Tax=Streptomyces hygroscopicus TaxID=1912 RepID=UPI0025A2FE89|nr:IS5 family transposase [Streptomyces hygroscopicus]